MLIFVLLYLQKKSSVGQSACQCDSWFLCFFICKKNNSRVGKSACQCESWGQRQTLARPKKAIFSSFVFDQKIIWINWILGISKRNYFHVHASLVILEKPIFRLMPKWSLWWLLNLELSILSNEGRDGGKIYV